MIKMTLGLAVLLGILTAVAKYGKFTVRKPINRQTQALCALAFTAICVAGWFYLTKGERIEDRILPPLIMPSPVEVIKAFPELHFQMGLTRSVLVSLKRVTIGFVLGGGAAFFLGVYMGVFTPFTSFFRLLSLVAAYVPIVVFIPMTMAWWGAGEQQKVGFLFIATLVALLPITIAAVSAVDNAYLDSAKAKGATQWQLVWKVIVPVAMPDIWHGMRLTYGIGWTWIILAELVNAQNGLGQMIWRCDRRSNTAGIYATIVVIICIAIVCDRAWVLAGHRLFPYMKRK